MNSKKIKALLVDDEWSALENLSILLNEFCPNIEIVAKVQSVSEALNFIYTKKIDLVFLDIEMPEQDGFELFKYTSANFKTIFVTAYAQYAIKAFEVSAVDYLLKPVDIERLKQAVDKIILDVNNHSFDTLQKNLIAKKITYISIPFKDFYIELNIEDIICIEASGSYTNIYFERNNRSEKILYSKNLNYFETLFAKSHYFFRIHRSWMVNTSKIISLSKSKNTVDLTHDITLDVSRRRMKEFVEFIKT